MKTLWEWSHANQDGMPACQSGGNGQIICVRTLSNYICPLGLGKTGSTRINRCRNTVRTVRVLAIYGSPMSGRDSAPRSGAGPGAPLCAGAELGPLGHEPCALSHAP